MSTEGRANYFKILLTSPSPVPTHYFNLYFRRHIFVQLFHYVMANWLPVPSLCKISIYITPLPTFPHTYTCTDERFLYYILKERIKEP